MKLVAKFIAITVAVLFVGRELVRAFASDETLIRWNIESMVEGFNDARLAKSTSAIHPEWRLKERSVTRPLLLDGLRSVYFQEKHPETRAFVLSAEIPEDSWQIAVDDNTSSATASFVVRFYREDTDPPTLEWEIRIDNELTDDEELGWSVLTSRYESLAGQRLGRKR